jgi:hypothetical protein
VLAGVQHQQQRPVGERLRHALCRNLAATKLKPHRCGNRGGNQAGIGERRKLGQPHAAGKVRQYLARGCERKLRFADAAGPGQRDQSMGANEAHDLRDLSITANQLGNRRRQVGRRQRPCGLRCATARTGALVRAP